MTFDVKKLAFQFLLMLAMNKMQMLALGKRQNQMLAGHRIIFRMLRTLISSSRPFLFDAPTSSCFKGLSLVHAALGGTQLLSTEDWEDGALLSLFFLKSYQSL